VCCPHSTANDCTYYPQSFFHLTFLSLVLLVSSSFINQVLNCFYFSHIFLNVAYLAQNLDIFRRIALIGISETMQSQYL